MAITSGGSTTTSAIDAVGDRVATASGGSFGYLLADLHGNMAAAFNAAGTSFSDAFAYDAWGEVVSSVTSSLPTPWRYQGRILESAAGTPDLYDFGARSYAPGIGTFTSLDSVHGSAQNPRLLNGYLYADANPATLVDPSGHAADCRYYGSSMQCKTSAEWGSTVTGGKETENQDCRYYGSSMDCRSSSGWGSTYTGQGEVRRASSTPQKASTSSSTPTVTVAVSGTQPGADPCSVTYEGFYRTECKTAGPAPTGTLGTTSPTGKTTREDAYKTCMGQYAYTQSGTSPDASQQAMTCQALVAKKFDPPSTDDSQEWAALKILACIEFCAVTVVALYVASDPAGIDGCLSFSASTAVATPSGSTAISSLRVGDTVMAYDPKTGETRPHTVSAVMVNTDPAVEHLRLDTGPIETTPDHPFFTVDRGWVVAGSLTTGEHIRTATGAYAVVLGFTVETTPSTMWDLTVSGAHTFFVSSGAVLVHNCSDGDWTDGTGNQTNLSGNNQVQNSLARAALQRAVGAGNVTPELAEEWKLVLEEATASGENLTPQQVFELEEELFGDR